MSSQYRRAGVALVHVLGCDNKNLCAFVWMKDEQSYPKYCVLVKPEEQGSADSNASGNRQTLCCCVSI